MTYVTVASAVPELTKISLIAPVPLAENPVALPVVNEAVHV